VEPGGDAIVGLFNTTTSTTASPVTITATVSAMNAALPAGQSIASDPYGYEVQDIWGSLSQVVGGLETYTISSAGTISAMVPNSGVAFYKITPLTQACITTTKNGPLTVSAGQALCVEAGGVITGPVTVKPGGALWVTGGTITGPLSATKAVALTVCGSTVSGPLTVTGTTGPVVIGSSTIPACMGNHISGPAQVTNSTDGVSFVGNTVSGPITVTGNGGPFTYSGNANTGPVTVETNT
ncbi:MAG: hypothetical protein ACRD6W_13830, partial [Nitrososphaerales archaeon]